LFMLISLLDVQNQVLDIFFVNFRKILFLQFGYYHQIRVILNVICSSIFSWIFYAFSKVRINYFLVHDFAYRFVTPTIIRKLYLIALASVVTKSHSSESIASCIIKMSIIDNILIKYILFCTYLDLLPLNLVYFVLEKSRKCPGK